MGIDYYACGYCGDTFPDCGHFVSCECGCNWCSDECAKQDGFREEEDGFIPEGTGCEQETSCNFCREESFPDYKLLNFMLEKHSISRKELIEIYKACSSS